MIGIAKFCWIVLWCLAEGFHSGNFIYSINQSALTTQIKNISLPKLVNFINDIVQSAYLLLTGLNICQMFEFWNKKKNKLSHCCACLSCWFHWASGESDSMVLQWRFRNPRFRGPVPQSVNRRKEIGILVLYGMSLNCVNISSFKHRL